jgi:putative tryptophan/tyrosine transport system substrate-binding protein
MTRLERSAARLAALGLVALALALPAAPLPGGAQPARPVPTVGFVGLPTDPSEARFQDGFVRGLRELGYVPGQTIRLDVRSYRTRDQVPAVLQELVRQKVDVIFVGQPFLAIAAKEVTRDIPIVCGSCGDPTENGLTPSLASPTGNVTGLATLSAELIGKRLELMKELFPGVARHAVFVFPGNPGIGATAAALDGAGRMLGLELQRLEIRGTRDFESAFRTAVRGGAGTVVLQDDPLLRAAAPRIAELALKNRMPVSTGLLEVVEAGALMSYGPDRVDLYRRAAGFVDRILKGARPRELPWEQATKLSLVLNLKTARALGVTLPQPIVLRADRVIE